MQDRYRRRNRRKFDLKVHVVIVVKYRKRLLEGDLALTAKRECEKAAEAHGWTISAMEVDADHLHVLLEYDTVERVCDIVKSLKQETTHALWMEHPGVLSQKFWKKRVFWSDGYFACSVGEASADTIRKYIESQG